MAGESLKIEEQYVETMGNFFNNYTENLESGLDSYLGILNQIKEDALMSGDTAEAFDLFIGYAEYLKGKIEALGDAAKTVCNNFMDEIDEKDQYLFEVAE